MLGFVTGALIAGLVGSPHCVGMCGGFASACATSGPNAAAYHTGRLLTYAALGALAGAFGDGVPLPADALTAVSVALTAWFSASLAGLVPSPAPTVPGLVAAATRALQRGGLAGGLAFGALTGLLPCGLVYSALGLAIAAGAPGAGAAAMVAFGLGTVPLLAGAAAGLRRLTARSLAARRGLALLVFLAGLSSILSRQGLLSTP